MDVVVITQGGIRQTINDRPVVRIRVGEAGNPCVLSTGGRNSGGVGTAGQEKTVPRVSWKHSAWQQNHFCEIEVGSIGINYTYILKFPFAIEI